MTSTRAPRRPVPSFSLYGQHSHDARVIDSLHIEDIPSRSRKYLWKIAKHRHAALSQCVYVKSGAAVIDLDETRRESRGPTLIIVPAGTVHAFAFASDTSGHVLTVDLERLLGTARAGHRAMILALFAGSQVVELGVDADFERRIGQLLETLLLEFNQPGSLASPVSEWLACSALWVIASRVVAHAPSVATTPADVERLRRFRALIETHYLQHWPVARYARRLTLSQSGLNRLCLELTGGTAFEVIQHRLALEARRRLVYVGGSVAAIAADLGFRDPAYFCRFFRKHTAESPSGFRRRHGGR